MLVTKVGGSIADDAGPALDDLADREPAALVHGFGPQTTRRAERAGHGIRWIRSPDGVRSRFTDEETLALMEQAADTVAERLARGLERREVPCRRVPGHEGLLRAETKPALRHRRPDGRTVLVRGNRSGRVASVDPRPIRAALAEDAVALVTPLARDDEALVSVDADRAAAAIAAALGADDLVLLTDVERVRDAEGRPLERLTPDEAGDLVAEGVAEGGMLRKLVAAREALEAGLDRVLVADGTRPRGIQRALRGEATEVVPA